MCRTIAITFALCTSALAADITTAPATRPSPPATTESAQIPLPFEWRESYVQAVQFMRENHYDKAGPLMEKIYQALPPAARSRSFVLNHAILDMTARVHVMRALRDLQEYLTAHRPEDEVATDILGAALETAVTQNPKWKQQAIWQAAFREWDRRNYNLEHDHPGSHRWGTKWLSDQEYAALKAQQDQWRASLDDQRERVRRAKWKLDWVNEQIAAFEQTVGDTTQQLADAAFARQEARRMKRHDLPDAEGYFDEQKALLEQIRQSNPRPQWPKHFDPVEPE